MVPIRRPRLIISGENGLMRGGDSGKYVKREVLLKGGFGIVFDCKQCEINLHREKCAQDRHDLHLSLFALCSRLEPGFGSEG